jgi:hypothetical protein
MNPLGLQPAWQGVAIPAACNSSSKHVQSRVQSWKVVGATVAALPWLDVRGGPGVPLCRLCHARSSVGAVLASLQMACSRLVMLLHSPELHGF